MNVEEQIAAHIASQPEPKRSEIEQLHELILGVDPASFDDVFTVVFVSLSAAFSPDPQRSHFSSTFPLKRSKDV